MWKRPEVVVQPIILHEPVQEPPAPVKEVVEEVAVAVPAPRTDDAEMYVLAISRLEERGGGGVGDGFLTQCMV